MDFLDCKICHTTYDEEEHRPRSAPCGHELCSVCLVALIRNGIFLCPKCRVKHKVNVPGDLPINFGLIDVIRAFKTNIISLTNANGPKTSYEMNNELCKVHREVISHRCLKCEMWICFTCLLSHSVLVGCSTICSSKAINNMKDKHSKSITSLLSIFREDTNYISSKLQEHIEKKKELLASAKKHADEELKFCTLLEQGNIHSDKLLESIADLKAITTNSPHVLMDKIEVLTHSKQSLRSWSIQKLGTDTLIFLLKDSNKGKGAYAEMIIKNEKRYAKISQNEEDIYFHSFSEQKVLDGCLYMPFHRLQKLIPKETSLVFLDLTMNNVKERLLLRLYKDLPKIREKVIQILTGQQDLYKTGIKFVKGHSEDVRSSNLPFENIQVNPDSNVRCIAKTGEVIGYFGNGYLSAMCFYIGCPYKVQKDYGSGWSVIGKIEHGLDIVQKCFKNYYMYMHLSDYGIVIEYE